MARTGLIRQGLASAGVINPQAMQKDMTEADKRAEAVQERVSRFAAGDTGTETTDGLKSLVGGLGAAAVFGGPAGVLIYGLSQAMSKKRREGVAAYRMHAAENAQQIAERTDAAVANLVGAADGEEQVAQAKFFKAEYDTIRAGLDSPDPATVAQTAINLQEFVGTLDDEYDEWIKRETEIEQGHEDQYNTLQDDLRSVSSGYLNLRDNWQRINALSGLEQNNINDMALVFSTLKMWDPESTVLPSEQANVTNAAAVPEAIRAAWNKLIDGDGSLDPTIRAEMINQADTIFKTALEQQRGIEADFIAKGRASKLPDRFLNNIGFAAPSDSIDFAGRKPAPRLNGGRSETTAEQPQAGPRVVEPSGPARGVAMLLREGMEFVEEIGRTARGDTVEEINGRYYEVSKDGTRTEIEAPQEIRSRDSNLVDGIVDIAEGQFGEAIKANIDAMKEADRIEHNARIRRERMRLGADPDTGIYPIKRTKKREHN